MRILSESFLPAPVNGGFKMDGYWVWCGSVVQGEDACFHMFASRWPRSLPFARGYIFASEVVRAVAETPDGPYRFAEVVLPDRGEGYWDGRMTHNPYICRWGGRYALFYIGATYSGACPTPAELVSEKCPRHGPAYNSIRIGLATSDSVTGPWLRHDEPILVPRPEQWDSVLVTNPSPCVLEDARILLYYRSNTPRGLRLGVAGARSPDDSFVRLRDDPILDFDDGNWIEDPFVWRNGEHFCMIAKDCRGGLTGEWHAGVSAHSSDGLNWALDVPPKAYSRTILWDDGRWLTQACLERPFLLLDGGRPTHLFAATADGPGGFHKAQNTWNMVIPLKSP